MIGINVVATGSKGNCYFIRDGDRYLCLDCGESVGYQSILKGCDFRIGNVDGVLVTHRHTDHLPMVSTFTRSGISVYSNDKTQEHVLVTQGEKITALPEKRVSKIGGWAVVPWYVPHEDVANYAYLIRSPCGEVIAYLTDFEYSPLTLKTYRVNHFLIAVNRSQSVPEGAEARFHRIMGHSTLEVVKAFLEASRTPECRSVTACHLSGAYADAGLILDELTKLCGDGVKVNIARRGMKLQL